MNPRAIKEELGISKESAEEVFTELQAIAGTQYLYNFTVSCVLFTHITFLHFYHVSKENYVILKLLLFVFQKYTSMNTDCNKID